MQKNLLAASSLLSSAFIFMLGNGLINILLPVRLRIELLDTTTIGTVLALYSVGLLLGGLYSKFLIRRVGHIRMFAACGALAAVGILACSLLANAWLWAAMRILGGFCNASVFTAIESWLSGGSTPENRGKILAMYQVVMQSAGFCGQFMINISDPAGDTLFVLSGMLLCLSIVPIVMSRQPGPKVADIKPMSFVTMAKLSPLGFTGCFFSGMMYFAMFNMLPLFASNYQASSLQLSIIMAGSVLGSFILQIPVGYLADRFDRRGVMVSLLALATLLALSVPSLIHLQLFWLPVVINGVICGIITCCYPLSIAEAYDKLRQEQITAAMGTLLVAYATGGIIGPILMAKFMAHWSDDALYYSIACIQVLFAAVVLLRMRMRKALPIDQQESFVYQSAAMPSATSLDPRTKFREAKFPLSKEARAAISVAESDPSAAVRMACALAKKKPKYSYEIAGALATVEQVDVLRLAYALSEAVPWNRRRIFQAVLEAREGQAQEIISFFAEHYIEDLADFAYTISVKMPQLRLIMAKIAFETLPESTDEIAEFYAQEFSDDLDSARPADAASGENEQNAADLVNQVTPDKAMDVAVKVVESMPESAANIAKEMSSTLADNYINNDDNHTDTDDAGNEQEYKPATGDERPHSGTDEHIAPHSGDETDDHISVDSAADRQQQRDDYTEALGEAISERVSESAVDIVQRLSEAAPESSIDIAVAVVANVPESSTQVAEAMLVDAADQLLNADIEEQAEPEAHSNPAPNEAAEDNTSDDDNEDEETPSPATPHDGALELLTRLKLAAPEQAEEMSHAVLKMISDINPALAETIVQQLSDQSMVVPESAVPTMEKTTEQPPEKSPPDNHKPGTE
ncbi:putative MFS family arabinose efflux permease [Sinobacterium caligoides]|uniref:Putative MFS family arabinose efflux permease n=1 Tax=Sinobacterium caligoides TaxID=933926 RepID=A0A3N2DR36_9GAMM|nr:MFS transporter [Sinobacterium caligoides]ROS01755.1 putative MFS family arabinose efflux permease [Sinobacterium caligoides]